MIGSENSKSTDGEEFSQKEHREKYQVLFESLHQSFCIIQMLFDENEEPVDYRFLKVNSSFKGEVDGVDVEGKRIREIAPNLEKYWLHVFAKVALTGKPTHFEHKSETQENRWVEVFAYRFGQAEDRQVAILFRDISERKQREERDEFLLRLSDELRPLTDPAAIQGEAVRLLREHFDVGWCWYAEIDEAGEVATILKDSTREGLPSLAGRHDVSDIPDYVNFLRTGQVLNVPDFANCELFNRRVVERYTAVGVHAMLGVSLVKEGRPLTQLVMHNTTPRNWTQAEIEILKEVVERTWAAVERARAEEAIRESEEKYHSLFNSIDEGYCIVEVLFDEDDKAIDYRFMEINSTFEKQTGLEDAEGKRMRDLEPKYEEFWFEKYGEVAKTGEPARFESAAKHLGERGFCYDVYAFRIGEPEKRQVAIIFNDISEQKQREERQDFLLKLSDALRAEPNVEAINRRALQMLYEYLGLDRCYVGIFQLAEDRGVFFPQVGNDRVPTLPGEVTLSDFPDALRTALDRTLVIDDVAEAEDLSDTDRQNLNALGMRALVASMLRKGEKKPIWSIIAVSAESREWTRNEITLIEEVTERTWQAKERAHAEETIRKNEERLSAATKAAEIGIWEINLQSDGPAIRSSRHDEIFGYDQPVDDWYLEDLLEHIHPDDRDGVEAALEEAIEDGGELEFNVRIIRADGELRWVYAQANIFYKNGEPSRLLGTIQDVTERKEAEEALRESEKRFRSAFEIDTVGVIFWGDDFTISEANNAFLHMSGFTHEEALGLTWQELTPKEFHPASERAVANLKTTGGTDPYEKQYIRKDGSRWWGLFAPRRLSNGEVVEYVIDITDSKEANEALRESEKKYRTLFDSIDEGFCIMQKVDTEAGAPSDYRYLETNATFEEQSGMKNAVGKTIREVAPSVDPDWIATYDEVLETGESKRFEMYLAEFDRILTLYAFRKGAPEEQKLGVIFNDITVRKRAEENLRESEEHFRLAAEVAQFGTWHFDIESNSLYFDKRMRDIWGVKQSKETLSFADVIKRVHSDDRQRVARAIEAALDPGNPVDSYSIEYTIVWDDSREHWIAANGQAQFTGKEGDRKPVRFFGTARDITRRKRDMNNLRESEERLQIALHTGKLGSWELNIADNNHLTSSDTCKANFGLSPDDELSYERLAEMIMPEDRERWQKEVTKAIEEQIDFNTEYAIRWPNSEKHWILARGRALYDSDGVPVKMIGVTLNITGQKQEEEELITLKNKLDTDLSVMTRLHELSLRLTSATDFQPMLEEILKAAIELQNADFGTLQLYNDETEMLELYVQQGFGPDFEKAFANVKGTDTACGRALKEGRRIIIEDANTDPEYGKKREALKFGYQSVQSTPLFDRGGNVLGILSTHFKQPHSLSKRVLRFTDLYARQAADMIDLKLTEGKLRVSEEELQAINETLEERVDERTSALLSYQKQLRSLASQLSKAEEQERQRLATELHDNLGQMLAVCKMKIELLEKDGQESEIAEASELVDEAITYTRELMSSLKPPPSLNDEDLKTAIEWVAAKMKKHGLNVIVVDDDQLKPLNKEVRATVLRAVRELLFNVIKHSGVDEAQISLSRTEDKIYITVEDKGKGFDINKQKSTESLNGGFGLFNISERMDLLEGSLNIESKPGKGTKATVVAPLVNNAGILREESSVFEGKQLEAVFRKEGSPIIKVLLADDHQVMREGLRRIIDGEKDLKIIGEASNGKEAVEKARELGPDVIVMDVNMPEMNGILATKEIKSELPHINVIGLSFHNDEDVARKMRGVGASAYLTKSDAFETLCATIRSEAMAVKE